MVWSVHVPELASFLNFLFIPLFSHTSYFLVVCLGLLLAIYGIQVCHGHDEF